MTDPTDVSLIPALITRVIDLCGDELTDVTVCDGWDTSTNSGTYLYVGADSPFQTSLSTGATSSQEWPNATGQTRTEEGAVSCATVAWDGAGDMHAARSRAFGIVRTVGQMLRRDTRLGGLDGLIKTSLTNLSYGQDQTDAGAVCLVTFDIAFTARIRGAYE